MPPKDKYTDPKLRDKVKEEIQQSDKGGAPGQWSARKAQMMAAEYKKRGGDYNTDKSEKDESQKNLDKWGEEDWQTKEGSGNAKKEDGTQKRYLPKKVWEKMTDEEKKETDEKKQEESKKGKQFVANTDKAKDKRKEATEASSGAKNGKKNEGEKKNGKAGEAGSKNGKKAEEEDDDDGEDEEEEDEDDEDEDDQAYDEDEGEEDEEEDDGEDNGEDDDEANDDDDDEDQDDEEEEEETSKETNQKRKSSQKSEQPAKKQKQSDSKSSGGNALGGTVGSKHMPDEEPGKRGSADRLPKKGQKISWKAMPGYVEGKVTEVLTKGKTVDGKSVKASKDDPRIAMTSNSSGKVCVHKPDACFYD